jgi:hypothetical protein
MLQHEQQSSGERNVLWDFSLQPALTFSFVIGSVRYFDHFILNFFVNRTVASKMHLLWHFIILIKEKSVPVFQNYSSTRKEKCTLL